MGKDTSIEWATHTFNLWRGCVEVSEGCAHCYARDNARRRPSLFGVWGDEDKGTRVVASEAKWEELHSFDAAAKRAGDRARVFVASLADVFEDWQGPIVDAKGGAMIRHVGIIDDWMVGACVPPHLTGRYRPLTAADVRMRLRFEMQMCPHLDFLLLTKRPQNAREMLDAMYAGYSCRHNLWLGTTVESRRRLDRIDQLRAAEAPVKFLSCEPLLEDLGPLDLAGIDWVIVGGESGPHARPFDLAWARSILAQCREQNVACFVKQMGSYPVADSVFRVGTSALVFRDSKGGDWDEWPADLRVREFPQGRAG